MLSVVVRDGDDISDAGGAVAARVLAVGGMRGSSNVVDDNDGEEEGDDPWGGAKPGVVSTDVVVVVLPLLPPSELLREGAMLDRLADSSSPLSHVASRWM